MAILRNQAAAIPIRDGLICLITSSNGERWIIPKGMIDRGHTPIQAALQEAWEEAGLVGIIQAEAAGSYVYEKAGSKRMVTVYPMQVTAEHAVYPEYRLRRREWVTPSEAASRIQEPGLRDILVGLFRLVSVASA